MVVYRHPIWYRWSVPALWLVPLPFWTWNAMRFGDFDWLVGLTVLGVIGAACTLHRDPGAGGDAEAPGGSPGGISGGAPALLDAVQAHWVAHRGVGWRPPPPQLWRPPLGPEGQAMVRSSPLTRLSLLNLLSSAVAYTLFATAPLPSHLGSLALFPVLVVVAGVVASARSWVEIWGDTVVVQRLAAGRREIERTSIQAVSVGPTTFGGSWQRVVLITDAGRVKLPAPLSGTYALDCDPDFPAKLRWLEDELVPHLARS